MFVPHCEFPDALQASVRVEVAVLQRNEVSFLDELVAHVQNNDDWNDQVFADEVEPRKDRSLKHADIRAEQHDQEQDECQPGSVREELGSEFEAIQAAALRGP